MNDPEDGLLPVDISFIKDAYRDLHNAGGFEGKEMVMFYIAKVLVAHNKPLIACDNCDRLKEFILKG